jgi:two-component system, OmpR family, alkaline phosphatase synthesis response regulator PhoP
LVKEKILVVDDEEDILELLKYNLAKEGYQLECVTTGESALEAARKRHPDLIVLDLMLPGVDGLTVCKTLKDNTHTAKIPVIMLTAKGEDADIVAGLELGADDYVTKPFSPRVLLARIRASLRKGRNKETSKEGVISVHRISIDPVRHLVTVDGVAVELSATEFGILSLLAGKPGWVFTRNQIINEVKGEDYPVTERSVDVQIVNLRKKLGAEGKNVETVRGVGYRMKE